jgi:LTXXQ motif family protein
MNLRFVTPLAMVAASVFAIPAIAANPAETNAQPGMTQGEIGHGMQHWAAERELVLDAKLAGMKDELKLKPDQEKLWAPFETAVREGAKDRMADIQKMMEMHKQNGQESPIDFLDAWSSDLSKAASDTKNIADAAKPLYASLDQTQKRDLAMLGRMLMPEHARFAMRMMHRRWNEGETDQ